MWIPNLIIGRRVKADHPITCYNPKETFIVKFVEENVSPLGQVKRYVRGEKTMWFHEDLIELAE